MISACPSLRFLSRVRARASAGYIQLQLPVFHIGFFKQTLAVLSCICKTCSHVLLDETESAKYYRAFRRYRVVPTITIEECK